MANRTTQEFVVEAGGDPFAFNYIEALQAALSQNWDNAPEQPGNEAFAPPTPEVLPEFEISPPKPTPAPPPGAAIPSLLTRVLNGALPWLGLLVPGAMGGAGEGDAPTEGSSVAARGEPPKPPPRIDPTFEEFEPPNWQDLSKGGKSDLMDTIYDRLVPVPLPPVELPDDTKFFDVFPPQPKANPLPNYQDWSVPDYGPDFEAQPFPTGPGPGPAPSPTGSPGIDPAPGYPEPGDRPEPRRSPQPDPTGDPAPDVFGTPLPDGIGDPIGDPFVEPSRPVRTLPEPSNPVRNRPGDSPQPFFDPVDTGIPAPNDIVVPLDQPLTQFKPDPFNPNKKDCTCEKPKKKKDKKRPPRTVCYRGTYKQNSRGITYKKIEQVPCEAKPTVKKSRAGAGLPGLSLTGEQAVDLVSQAVSEFAPIVEDYLRRKYKPKKEKKPKRNRKAKTKVGRIPGTINTTPFPNDPY